MREAGIIVNDIPKIQVNDPDVMDHSIFLKEIDLRIPLCLHGVFSGFITSKPTTQMINECEDVYVITPPIWNPHETVYAHNED